MEPITIYDFFEDRELRLIRNVIAYINDDPAGLPGHKLMMIIAAFCLVCDLDVEKIDAELKRREDDNTGKNCTRKGILL